MAAQDLEFTSIGQRGHLNTGSSMKEKRPMGRSSEMGICRHTGKFKPITRFLRSNEPPIGGELSPGIPNEVTYDLIVPKLSWRDLLVLSSVSLAWEEAITTNRVHEERARANSTEWLIIHAHVHAPVHNCFFPRTSGFALYSPREKCCYKLPQIPCLPPGFLDSCQCIAVDGKIYVLGGYEVLGGEYMEGKRVYVLDLARGQWKWKQCASMLEPRFGFGCGVVDDKIYVFGGTDTMKCADICKNLPPRSEVYDTHKNTWSSIMPMRHSTTIFRFVVPLVAPIGNELLLYRGYVGTSGVYNPAKDEWRFVEGWEGSKLVFAAEGKFYSISQSGLHVYDVEQKSWIIRHTHSFAHRPDYSPEFSRLSITAVKDELFLSADWRPRQNRFCPSFHAKGFGTEQKEIVWQKMNCAFGETCKRVLQVPIQL